MQVAEEILDGRKSRCNAQPPSHSYPAQYQAVLLRSVERVTMSKRNEANKQANTCD